jgi:hypothetical protein
VKPGDLFKGMEAFAREQSKLLSPNLIASTTDYRGAVIGAWRLVWLEEPDGAGSVHKADLREQAAEAVTHLAFYAGWPNVFSALPVMKDVFEKRPH